MKTLTYFLYLAFIFFAGCEENTDDYSLHDIWALRELDGKTLDRGAFQKGDPSLEIQVED